MSLEVPVVTERHDVELVDGFPVLAPGQRLGRDYTVVELLSRGDALDVYTVWSGERSCVCVAKAPRPDRAHHDRVRRRLLQEGRLLLGLSHPHLVRAYEVIDTDPPVVVLETLPGETLSHILDDRVRGLPLTHLAYLGLHLCSALGYLHRAGFLHLDLKPDNVIVSGGIAKLIDLSLARPPGRGPRGMGTRGYLAPEQATGDELTAATDVWGLGVTLYEAAANVETFPAEASSDDAPRELRYPQLVRRPAPLRRLRRTLPAAFTDLVDSCLAVEPARRPTLEHVATVLGQVVADPVAALVERSRAA